MSTFVLHEKNFFAIREAIHLAEYCREIVPIYYFKPVYEWAKENYPYQVGIKPEPHQIAAFAALACYRLNCSASGEDPIEPQPTYNAPTILLLDNRSPIMPPKKKPAKRKAPAPKFTRSDLRSTQAREDALFRELDKLTAKPRKR